MVNGILRGYTVFLGYIAVTVNGILHRYTVFPGYTVVTVNGILHLRLTMCFPVCILYLGKTKNKKTNKPRGVKTKKNSCRECLVPRDYL